MAAMNDMVEVKVSELIGPALDWSVAVADGVQPTLWDVCCGNGVSNGNPNEPPECCCNPIVEVAIGFGKWKPSTDWSQGGPLIDKHQIAVRPVDGEWWCAHLEESATLPRSYGRGALVAICLAIVAANLGDTVSVPKELMP
jgi:hypothetical protein